MAKFQISKSVEINRPAEDVYKYVTDFAKLNEWRPPHVSHRDVTGDPQAVGTTWNEVTKFMGRDMVVNNEVTAVQAGRHWAWKMEGGVVTGNTSWLISPGANDTCTATLTFDGEISGWLAALAAGLLRNQAEKDMTRDLGNLKANLEAS